MSDKFKIVHITILRGDSRFLNYDYMLYDRKKDRLGVDAHLDANNVFKYVEKCNGYFFMSPVDSHFVTNSDYLETINDYDLISTSKLNKSRFLQNSYETSGDIILTETYKIFISNLSGRDRITQVDIGKKPHSMQVYRRVEDFILVRYFSDETRLDFNETYELEKVNGCLMAIKHE